VGNLIYVKYQVSWYELDQTIYQNQIDYFYIDKHHTEILNDFASDNDIEIRGKINSIKNTEIGEILGFITYGLDYKMVFLNKEVYEINAEEEPGKIYNNKLIQIKNWEFIVEIDVFEETGNTSLGRIKKMTITEKEEIKNKRVKEMKDILGLEIIVR
jgi:hypothetical protein